MPGTHPKWNSRKYTEEQLQNALREIRENHLSYREASAAYGIPKTTLADKIKGRSKPTLMKKGKSTNLSQEVEARYHITNVQAIQNTKVFL